VARPNKIREKAKKVLKAASILSRLRSEMNGLFGFGRSVE
jgi:hypothetical protein